MQVTGSQTGTVAKAKAAYDYLFTTMRYDKTGSGWGRGDAVWACDAKHGNCTDFHSPFIGMLRADGIPARFDIGFPLPEDKEQGRYSRLSLLGRILRVAKSAGFRSISRRRGKRSRRKIISSAAWTPIVCSSPPAATLRSRLSRMAPALNYFVYPYVEVDGKPYEKLEKQFSFEEVPLEKKSASTKDESGSGSD